MVITSLYTILAYERFHRNAPDSRGDPYYGMLG